MKKLELTKTYRYFNDGLEKHYSDLTATTTPELTLTQQQFKDENDPNIIIEKFARTGDPALLSGARQPMYVDLLDAPPDYQSALETVMTAEKAFLELPARVRARFENDPHSFFVFCSDPANREEALKLGMLKDELYTEPLRSPIEQAKASVDNSSNVVSTDTPPKK